VILSVEKTLERGGALNTSMQQRKISALCRGLILVGFTFILIFGPFFYGGVETWQMAILASLSMLIFAAWAVANAFTSQSEIADNRAKRTAMLVYGLPILFGIIVIFQLIPLPESILGFLSPAKVALNKATGTEGSTPASVLPHTTQLWLVRVMALVMVFIVAAQSFASRQRVLYVIALIVILGYMNAVYGILLYLSDGTLPSLFERKYYLNRATGTYVCANNFAGYLEMCTPLALSVLFIKRSSSSDRNVPFRRRMVNFLSEKLQDKKVLLPLTAIIIMVLGIIFSMSRMGIFSFAISFVLFGLLIGKRHRKRMRIVVLSSIVGLVLIFSLWLGLDPVLERYSLLGGDTVLRVKGWELTRNVIKNYPILGTGLGTFTHVSPNYQTLSTAQGHWTESHNDYLNLMSDTGIIGFTIAIAFLATWYIYILKLLSRKSLRTYQRSIALGCVAGVSAIVIHSIADFNLQIPANAFYFATLLGLAIAVLRFEDFPHSDRIQDSQARNSGKGHVALRPKRLFTAKGTALLAAVLAAVIALPFTVKSALAESWLTYSREINDVESKIQALENSIYLDRNNAESHYLLGMIDYWKKKDFNAAKNHFTEAVRLAPTTGKYHFRLGMTYARLGNDVLSEKELSFAKKLAPTHCDLYFKIGYYHFFKGRRVGDPKLIVAALSEFRRAAELGSDYLWQALNLVEGYLPGYEYLKQLVPDTPEHHRSFANFLASKERWAEALKEYRTTWRLTAAEDISYCGGQNLCLASAKCYLMIGEVGEAKRGYIKALGLEGNKQEVFHTVRADFGRAKLLKEGLAFLYSLKPRFPHYETLDIEIAKTHFALAKYDQAEKLLLELSDLRPTEEIYRYLFDIAMRRRDFDLAEVYADKAIRLAPSEAANHALFARAKAANKDYKGAAQALRQAITIEPENNLYKEELIRINECILFERK